MSLLPYEELQRLVSTHGYWAIALVVGLESMGMPLPGETIKESPVTTRMIVLGGSELAEDKMFAIMRYVGTDVYVNGFRAIHNMVDWLVEEAALIAVRGKQVERPLASLDDGKRLFVKYGNIAGPPLALVAFGLVYWRVRERRRRNVVI